MTKVIRFSRFRIIFPVISFAIIAVGLIITLMTGGLNLGIDFRPGLNIRLQIAPVAARVSYTGEGTARLNIRGDEFVVSVVSNEGTTKKTFSLSGYNTLGELQDAVAEIPGFVLEPTGGTNVEPSKFLSLEQEMEVGSIPVSLNVLPGADELIGIAAVRAALESIGTPQIQTIGASDTNDFMIRIQEKEGATDFDTTIAEKVRTLLSSAFGAGWVLIRETDYVGARFSSNLAQQTGYLSVLALLLILAYVWFRFQLAYAVSAIIALVHDSLFIFAFIGATGLEFSTATIAAVLTIIGYSLNDTIVIFDRIRENTGIMRNDTYLTIVDTSISQSLSRTLMTSLTTLLAVVAIYIFGTGSIRDFALAMIVGVVVGTYSSIFVASPILVGWVGLTSKRRKVRDAKRYHVQERDDRDAAAAEAKESDVTNVGVQSTPVDKAIPFYDRKPKGKRKKKK